MNATQEQIDAAFSALEAAKNQYDACGAKWGTPEWNAAREGWTAARRAFYTVAAPKFERVECREAKNGGFHYVGTIDGREIILRKSAKRYLFAVVHSYPQNTKFLDGDRRGYVTFHQKTPRLETMTQFFTMI